MKYRLADSFLVSPYSGAESVNNFDVIVNQKTDEVIMARPGLTVFDCDDDLPAILANGARSADMLTFDTDIRCRAAMNAISPKPTFSAVIPDCIDYEPTEPFPASPGLGVAWFGNVDNYHSAKWMFSELAAGVPRVMISEKSVVGFNFCYHWNYETFAATLRTARVAFLSHLRADQAKSANKLIAAITLGVPVIVSGGSPSYEEILRNCGVEWAIVNTGVELRNAYDRMMKPGEREVYLARTQPFIWSQFNSQAVARRAVELYGVALEVNRERR